MSQHKLRFLPCYRKNCTGQLLTRDSELPFPIFFLVVLFEAQSAGRDDCVAGHVGLELRNVGKNYPFERSRRFPDPKSSEWRPYMFARDQWHCRICGESFLYSEMVRKHIANEHNETMPPSMYEYFDGAVWQRKKLP